MHFVVITADGKEKVDIHGDADTVDGEHAGAFADASHAHAGTDITSGTVADARIASSIARDSEVTSSISTHTSDVDAHHVEPTATPTANKPLLMNATPSFPSHTVAGNLTATGEVTFGSGDADAHRFEGEIGIGKAPSGGLRLDINLATEDLAVADAGSAGATEQDWIEVTVGGNTGYIRVFAAK